MKTDFNRFTTNEHSIQISGIDIDPGQMQKRILSFNVLFDGENVFTHRFKNQLQDGDTPLRLDLPPLIFQPGCDLELRLRRKGSFIPFRTSIARAFVSWSYAQYLMRGVPLGQRKEYKFAGYTMTFASTELTVLDLLGKSRMFLETFLEFGTAASELHPIAEAVFASINKVYQKLKDQEVITKDVLDLAENVACAICYLADVTQFAMLVQLKDAIEDARALVEDATDLILRITAQSSGAANALHVLVLSSDRDKFDELSKRFNRFRQQFNRGLGVLPSVTLDLLQKLLVSEKEERLLAELKPPGFEDLPRVTGCMPDTREDILTEIHRWVENFDTTPNILWLTGAPGVGKSTVASTLVENLRASRRLGSSFFFNRANATVTTPTALWRKVAFDLAHKYPAMRKVVMEKLDGGIVGTGPGGTKALFLDAIKDALASSVKMPSGRFPVIVIDALDECGGLDGPQSDHRKLLLKTLKSWSHFPPQFKLVITSRDEEDLRGILGSISHHMELASGRNASPESSHDIYLFLQTQFKEITEHHTSLPDGWPGLGVIYDLTSQTAGLFIWAETIVKLVQEGDPEKQLKYIQEGNLGKGDMTALYRLILDISFKNPSGNVVNSFTTVIGAIISAKTPLCLQDYTSLLSVEASMLKFICKGLQSVMETEKVLQFHHQSFVDFLLDPKSCPPAFWIDGSNQTQMLKYCLKSMWKGLQFNICGLETSHVSNDKAPNCHAIAHNPIPTYLKYSCQYWVDHLIATGFDKEIIKKVQIFMYKQLFFWLEVLSIIKKIDIAREALLHIVKWCKSHDDNTAAFASDAAKFVTAFGGLISHSIPHLYLSALPFAPIMSKVSMGFLHHFPQTLSIKAGKATDWSITQYVINAHSGAINSVAFSPDGTQIISGSYHGICVWNAASGNIIAGPLARHQGVMSIALAPNGTHIVSGGTGCSIRVCDTISGNIISGTSRGHNDYINSVAFSPDGTHIVSGSDDTTIRVWAAASGETYVEPFVELMCDVKSVAFSSDGMKIVSGSRDIHVWDAASGKIITGPFGKDINYYNSVAFSPDDKHIVSGSHDIYVWNTVSGDVIAGPFKGHIRSQSINSVAFSPDGTKIVSGSNDTNICIWDAASGEIIAGHLKGHTASVNSVAFSPDGIHIVSGSDDGTIRVWNVGDLITGQTQHSSHSYIYNASPSGLLEKSSIDHSYDPFNILKEDSKIENGWLLGPDNELLFWIPPWTTLLKPQNTVGLSQEMTCLDLSKFVHGTQWQLCGMKPTSV